MLGLAALKLTGCVVGPKHHPPAAPAPPAYKEVGDKILKPQRRSFSRPRATLRYNRADYYPNVTAGSPAARTCGSVNLPGSTVAGRTYNDFVLPFDLSYQVDAWGQVRKTMESYREQVQASAARLGDGQSQYARGSGR